MKAMFEPMAPDASYLEALREMQGMYTAIPADMEIEIRPGRDGYLASY